MMKFVMDNAKEREKDDFLVEMKRYKMEIAMLREKLGKEYRNDYGKVQDIVEKIFIYYA